MNRARVIPLVCLVGCLVFAIIAQAAQLRGKLGEAEAKALEEDKEELMHMAEECKPKLGSNWGSWESNNKEKTLLPVAMRLVKGIERTRRTTIEKRLSHPADGANVSAADLKEAHELAYAAIDDKLTELGKTFAEMDSTSLIVYRIEELINKRMEAIEELN